MILGFQDQLQNMLMNNKGQYYDRHSREEVTMLKAEPKD